MKIKHLNIFLIFLLLLSTIGSVNAANENTNPDKNLLEELGKYYHDELGTEWTILKLDSNKLKYGDYIQLRNFKDEALQYLFKDSNGYVYFDNNYGRYRCKQDEFDRLYTGYALLLNY